MAALNKPRFTATADGPKGLANANSPQHEVNFDPFEIATKAIYDQIRDYVKKHSMDSESRVMVTMSKLFEDTKKNYDARLAVLEQSLKETVKELRHLTEVHQSGMAFVKELLLSLPKPEVHFSLPENAIKATINNEFSVPENAIKTITEVSIPEKTLNLNVKMPITIHEEEKEILYDQKSGRPRGTKNKSIIKPAEE